MPKIILQETDNYIVHRKKLIQKNGDEFVNRLNQITELIARRESLPPECNLCQCSIHIVENKPQAIIYRCNITKDILLYFDYTFKIKGVDVHLEIQLINIGDKDMLYK